MSPFIKVTSKYCPNCNQDTLSVLTNGHKSKPEFIEYVCKNCNHKYIINWSDPKNPRPVYTNYKILKSLYGIK